MQVVITGGAGFIGSHITEMLAAKDHEITVIDNFSTGKPENLAGLDVKIIKKDICDTGALKQAFNGIDCVFHTAAIVSVPYCETNQATAKSVNGFGTYSVLEAAKAARVKRVIYTSTAAVYGDYPVIPVTEKAALDPLCKPKGIYAQTKKSGERHAHEYRDSLEAVILRCFNVYGPRQDPASPYSGVIAKFITKLKNKETPIIYGNGEQTRDFVHVTDIARAHVLAMEAKNAANQTINIASGTRVSINQLYETICDLLRISTRPRHEPKRPGEITHSCADISKARQILGYNPTITLREGLEKTLASYQ